jgi:hypothetical protein
VFTHLTKNKVWPLLLEKAYAKFAGSFAAIEGGNPVTGLKVAIKFQNNFTISLHENRMQK